MASLIYNLVRNRKLVVPLANLRPEIISNKTVLVTGANTGLGLEAARHYAHFGAARLILAVRSESKGQEAKKNIEASLAPHSKVQIDVWILDLASFESVKRFGARIHEELDSLDIAVLNAAISKSQYSATDDGWDESLQVNHLSTILLGLLILPKLKESTARFENWTARLDFVASRAHQFVAEGASWQSESNILKALNEPQAMTEGIQLRYGTTKLLLIYGVREVAKLATTSEGKPAVIVNYTCPGATRSDLARDARKTSAGSILLFFVDHLFSKTTEEGSRTLLYATCLGEESHGKWIHNDHIAEPGVLVYNKTGQRLQKQIWDETREVLGKYL